MTAIAPDTAATTATIVANLRAWAAALESGAYPQAQGQLRAADGYCCLGVLCDLRVQAGHGRWVREDVGALRQLAYTAPGWPSATTLLPDDLAIAHGLTAEGYRLDGRSWRGDGLLRTAHGVELALTAENDNGATFATIAGAIRDYATDLETGATRFRSADAPHIAAAVAALDRATAPLMDQSYQTA